MELQTLYINEKDTQYMCTCMFSIVCEMEHIPYIVCVCTGNRLYTFIKQAV